MAEHIKCDHELNCSKVYVLSSSFSETEGEGEGFGAQSVGVSARACVYVYIHIHIQINMQRKYERVDIHVWANAARTICTPDFFLLNSRRTDARYFSVSLA
jgi:hypothetical protein